MRQLNELAEPKPADFNGLGSLSSLKSKSLVENQVTKVIKTLNKQQRVNDEDADVMLDVYKRYTSKFLNPPTIISDSDGVVSNEDVENYLSLILQHDNLRNEVSEITQQIITREIKRTARFGESEITRLGENAGNLASNYVNAYNQTAAKNRAEKRIAPGNQQGRNKISVVDGYEQAAIGITENKKESITAKEKDNSENFFNDLRQYNDSLSTDWKILDSNGKLIAPSKMTAKQRASIEDIFSGETNLAGDRLSSKMRTTYDELLDGTARRVNY